MYMPTLRAPLAMTNCLTRSLSRVRGPAGDHHRALDVLHDAVHRRQLPRRIRVVHLGDGSGPAREVGDGHEVVAAVVVALRRAGVVAAAPDEVVLAQVHLLGLRRLDLGLERRDVGERPAGAVGALVLDRSGDPPEVDQAVGGREVRARGPGSHARADADLDRARQAAEAQAHDGIVQRLDEGGIGQAELELWGGGRRARSGRQRGDREQDERRDDEGAAAGGGHREPFSDSGCWVVSSATHDLPES